MTGRQSDSNRNKADIQETVGHADKKIATKVAVINRQAYTALKLIDC